MDAATENSFKLPVNLEFDGKGGFKPGRGFAGWTVYEFATATERAEFMIAHREAHMPCWKRIEACEAALAKAGCL